MNGSALRLNPSRGSVTLRTNGGDSHYNSLQVRLERGFKNGFLLRSTYTFSKTIDDVNSEVFITTGGSSVGSDPFNKATDRGLADFDVPHVFTVTGLFDLPTFGTEGFVKKVLSGFRLSGIYRLQSGAVTNPYLGGVDLNGDGNAFNDRPLVSNPNGSIRLVAFADSTSPTGFTDQRGNPINFADARFSVDPALGGSPAGRNTLRGPRFQRLDMSLTREFGLGFTGSENLRFQVRADFFNVLNIPNYTPGTGNVFDTEFNDPYTQGEGSGRFGRIQLRLSF